MTLENMQDAADQTAAQGRPAAPGQVGPAGRCCRAGASPEGRERLGRRLWKHPETLQSTTLQASSSVLTPIRKYRNVKYRRTNTQK